jgi:hypothetical protein
VSDGPSTWEAGGNAKREKRKKTIPVRSPQGEKKRLRPHYRQSQNQLEKASRQRLSWTQGGTEAQEPAVCTARSRLQLALHARRDPFRDKIREVGRGLSLADTQTGRYGRLYSRRRLCARRGADARLLLRILLELVQPLATLASPRAKSLIPIPVPVQYRLSRCLE